MRPPAGSSAFFRGDDAHSDILAILSVHRGRRSVHCQLSCIPWIVHNARGSVTPHSMRSDVASHPLRTQCSRGRRRKTEQTRSAQDLIRESEVWNSSVTSLVNTPPASCNIAAIPDCGHEAFDTRDLLHTCQPNALLRNRRSNFWEGEYRGGCAAMGLLDVSLDNPCPRLLALSTLSIHGMVR